MQIGERWQVGARLSSKYTQVQMINEVNSFTLFPNPNDGRFTVNLYTTPVNKRKKVSVLNSNGKILINHILEPELTSKFYDLSFLNPGIYFFTISVGKNSSGYAKLIIQ